MRWLRLRAIWILVVPFLWLADPTPALLAGGAILAALGLTLRGWAAGVLQKERVLTVVGPYAHTRNPLYLGSLLLGVGVTLAGGRIAFVVLFLLFFVGVYGRTMRGEEELLADLFGEDYRRYADAVPLLVPRLTPYRPRGGGEEGAFSFGRYRRNREYEAALGSMAGFAFLLVKMMLERG